VTSNLAGTPSDCGTVPYVTTKPDENLLIIGVVTQGVFASNNGGNSWFKLGQGSGSDAFTAGLSLVQFDPLDTNRWWLSGVRFGTPYKTLDKGNTFKKLADFPLNDGIAVDFSDPDRKTLVLGGHEQVQEVQYSADGGLTWTNIGATLPTNSGHSSYPVVINENTFLIGTSNNEIYRTTDKGAHWTKVASGGGGAMPLKHSDGSFYWASRDTSGLWRSTNNGETWTQVTANGIVFGMTPIELPDHRIVMRSPMGMLVSSDHGINWRQITPPIPNDYFWYVSTYSTYEKAFFTTRFGCDGSKVVNADAVMRYSWDYTID